mmetsp:Transcript_2097/g.4855  ORF Transcript_2097/g.4855 Transcript_2097/m.4855 type:complete len:502 (+) Transcript_2097:208-1713(+)
MLNSCSGIVSLAIFGKHSHSVVSLQQRHHQNLQDIVSINSSTVWLHLYVVPTLTSKVSLASYLLLLLVWTCSNRNRTSNLYRRLLRLQRTTQRKSRSNRLEDNQNNQVPDEDDTSAALSSLPSPRELLREFDSSNSSYNLNHDGLLFSLSSTRHTNEDSNNNSYNPPRRLALDPPSSDLAVNPHIPSSSVTDPADPPTTVLSPFSQLVQSIVYPSTENMPSSSNKKPSGAAGGPSSEPGSPEYHWNNSVLKEVSKEQIGFIAEGLFKELWVRCGQEVAIDQVSLMIAEVQFSRGFDLLYKVHDNDAALVEFRKCLVIRERILGKDHRDTGKTYCFVGHALREQREYDDAVGQYRSALRILVALLGKDHNHTKDVISCIDDVLKAKGLPDPEVSDYLTTLLSSMEHKRNGDEFGEEGNFDMAVGEYKKALIVERIPEAKYHPDTGEIYSKIGACLARQGELKRACVEYGNALSIYAVTLGSDHHDTKDALRNIQNLPALMIR